MTAASGTGSPSATTSQSYDNYGNVATVVGPLVGQTTAYFHDLNRDLLGAIGPLASGQTTYPTLVYTWSPNGQVTQVALGTSPNQMGLANVTVLEQQNILYDALGRRAQASLVSGGATQTLSQWTYDNANRLVCAAVRMNPATFAAPPPSACVAATPGSYGADQISYHGYDAADEPTQVTLGYLSPAQLNYATLTYSPNGYVQTVKDAANNLTTTVYDPFDRVSQVQFPMPTTGSNASNPNDYEGYSWDNNGNLLTLRRRSTDTLTFAYDHLNRPVTKQYSAGPNQEVFYSYDLLNRVLYAHYGSATGPGIDNAYDALGRTVSTAASGRTLGYQYDAAGNRTRLTWPDTGSNALYEQYVYDALNRVTAIEENGATSGSGVLASYGYDSLGRRSSITRGNTSSTSYGWDGANRLASLAQNLTGSGAVTYNFTYSPAGQIMTRQVSNAVYTYHPPTQSAAYVVNGLNQYASVGGTAFTYTDKRGNLTSDGTRSFTYDLDNNLLTASGPTQVALTYDPSGRLQTSTAAGATTTFLYDGANLVGLYDGSGGILSRYAPGPGTDEPVVWYSGAGQSNRGWLHQDDAGSIITWSNITGTGGPTYAYGPYGEPDSWGGPRYRYTGQAIIPEAQLTYYKARVYDQAIGRFLQTDPAGYASDINAYGYAGNDPVNGSDPSGMAGDNAGNPNCPMCVAQSNFPIGDGTFTDAQGNTWQLDGQGHAFLLSDFNIVGGGPNLFDQIFQNVAIQSLSQAFSPQVPGGGASFGGLAPQNKGCTAAGSNNFSTAVDRVGDVHGSIYSGGAAALKSGGQAESATALARAGIPAGVGLAALSESYSAAQDHANGMSWGRSGTIHGSGFVGGLLGGFFAGELVDPLGGGVVGAIAAGVVGGYVGGKAGETAGAFGASAVGVCR